MMYKHELTPPMKKHSYLSEDSSSFTISPYKITADVICDVVSSSLSSSQLIGCCILTDPIVQSKYFRTGRPASLVPSVNISTLRILVDDSFFLLLSPLSSSEEVIGSSEEEERDERTVSIASRNFSRLILFGCDSSISIFFVPGSSGEISSPVAAFANSHSLNLYIGPKMDSNVELTDIG